MHDGQSTLPACPLGTLRPWLHDGHCTTTFSAVALLLTSAPTLPASLPALLPPPPVLKLTPQAGHATVPTTPAGTRTFCPHAVHEITTFCAAPVDAVLDDGLGVEGVLEPAPPLDSSLCLILSRRAICRETCPCTSLLLCLSLSADPFILFCFCMNAALSSASDTRSALRAH